MTNFIDDVIDGKTMMMLLMEKPNWMRLMIMWKNGIIQIHIVVCPNILE